jgi:tetratricopeptide (TPR) repeat protein
MMLTTLAAALLASSSAPAATAPSGFCTEEQGCAHATAAQMFALADKLYEQGDLAGAVLVLEALTQDVHPELRAEARFRLAAVREKMGDLKGAAQALKDLLAEQPSANPARLELARILGLMGEKHAARAELDRAEAWGLPAEVQENVRRFSTSLQTTKRRGLTLELASGPDSNINRATSAQYVDTIIAPFELDPNARRQSGVGFTIGAQAFTRNAIGSTDLQTRAGIQADLFDKTRFNDIEFAADIGPELHTRFGQIRPAGVHERRWYGGSPYSTGWGGSLNWVFKTGARSQLELNAARVKQDIKTNDVQDGWRTSANLDLSRSLGQSGGVRLTLRYGALDARVRPESLRQYGGGLFAARQFPQATLFIEADYTRTNGLEPLFLFGKTRHEDRVDLFAGTVLSAIQLGGFSPLVRLTHSKSSANISIYDYRKTRLDLGVSRSF